LALALGYEALTLVYEALALSPWPWGYEALTLRPWPWGYEALALALVLMVLCLLTSLQEGNAACNNWELCLSRVHCENMESLSACVCV